MRNLLWKEWHEQSWKLAFGCIVLSALALIGLHARITADQTLSMWVCVIGITLLPILSSTGLLPAERADNTFESLLSLPISPIKILAAKTAIGLLLCIGPMLVAMIISILFFGGREMTDTDFIDLYARSTLATISLFIWMLALTARLPNESRAALLSVGILIFWLIATSGLGQPNIPHSLFIPSPMAFVFQVPERLQPGPSFLSVLLAQAIITPLLWLWTATCLTQHVEEK